MEHPPGAPENAVGHQLGGNDEVEGGEDAKIGYAGSEGVLRGAVQEKGQHVPAGKEIQQEQGQAQKPHQLHPGPESGPHPGELLCADVLGGVVGHTVGQGGEGGDDQVVQLYSGGVARHNAGAKAVDAPLEDDVAHGDEALLEDAGDGNDGNFFQQQGGEHRRGLRGFHLSQAGAYHTHRQDAADSLAEEGGPGHASHPHVKGGDKEDIHRDVGSGGGRQEEERGPGVSQGGEYAGGDVVEKDEGQAPDVDIQVELGGGEGPLRGVDEPEQPAAAKDASQHQRPAEDGAGDAGGGHRRFHLPVLPGPEELGDHHGAAHVAPEGESQENQRHLVAVAHGGQGFLADELPGHQAVGDVVELLENDASKQRKTEFP